MQDTVCYAGHGAALCRVRCAMQARVRRYAGCGELLCKLLRSALQTATVAKQAAAGRYAAAAAAGVRETRIETTRAAARRKG